jgi:hypothetical protein
MNSNRKADLQRKLSMASVPKPPAGLSERIKQDIPEFLRTEPERQRFSKLLSVNMRVAASILLLVSSTYLCLHILSRASSDRHSEPMAMASQAAKSIAVPNIIPNVAPPEPRQRVIAPNVPPAAPQRAANIAPPVSMAEQIALHRELPSEKKELERDEDRKDGVVGGKLEERAKDDTTTVVAEAPTVTTDALAPKPAPVAEPSPTFRDAPAAGAPIAMMQKTSRAEIVRSASAGSLDLAARNSIFGVSVNGNAFEQVKSAIERGEHPSHVDVQALVNYFAGAAARPPREVSLEVEGSPAPTNAEQTVFIRYTVDTARDDVAPNASVPPIATNARMEVEFDPRAVASYRRIGGDESPTAFESSLLKNVSVTSLYVVQLRPTVTRRMPLATITLHYKNVTSGRERGITRQLRVGDVTQPWSESSRRHRLASLGAVWGEQLQSSTSGADVARRAEELAKQEPKDLRAKELAALASASSR